MDMYTVYRDDGLAERAPKYFVWQPQPIEEELKHINLLSVKPEIDPLVEEVLRRLEEDE